MTSEAKARQEAAAEIQMTEGLLESELMTIIEEAGLGVRVETFEEAGLLTHDSGLLLRFADGREFQISIVRSRS